MVDLLPAAESENKATNRFIAIFDVLGFRNMMKIEGSTTLALKLADIIERSKSLKGTFAFDHISIHVFQDTICIYTDATSSENLRDILGFSAMVSSLAFNSFIYLRGAITEGEVYAEDNLIIGDGFIKAYDMHEAQDWAGTWVDQEMLKRWTLKDGEYTSVVPYEIPLKSGKVEVRQALNTMKFTFMGREVAKYVFSEIKKKALTWDAKRKMDNTEAFFYYLIEKGYCTYLDDVELKEDWG